MVDNGAHGPVVGKEGDKNPGGEQSVVDMEEMDNIGIIDQEMR